MSTREIRYDLESPGAERKACADTLAYLGFRTYYNLARAIKYSVPEQQHRIRLAFMMQGVQGYPVEAMFNHYQHRQQGSKQA